MDVVFDIDPVAAPRMTRKDKIPSLRSVRVDKYFGFRNVLLMMANLKRFKSSSPLEIFEFPCPLSVTFIVKTPDSWALKKRKRHWGKPHLQRPDLDNFVKALKDTFLEEDSVIWKYKDIEKIWGEKGQIIFHEV